MAKILVVYFSATGNTKRMAEAVLEGASSVETAECLLKFVQFLKDFINSLFCILLIFMDEKDLKCGVHGLMGHPKSVVRCFSLKCDI